MQKKFWLETGNSITKKANCQARKYDRNHIEGTNNV
jgi:hypothetical protein